MTSVRASEIPWSNPSAPALDLNGPTVPFRRFCEDWVNRPAIDLFRSSAEEFGDRIACEDLAERLTYAQVWAACRRLASMIDAAVPTGQPIGILLPNEASYPVAVLACLVANRPCVMIDRHHPEDRVAAIVRDAGVAAIILRRSDIADGLLLPAGIRTIMIDEALLDGPAPDWLTNSPMPPPAPSFIVYTSGSTGHPKGIVLSQRAVLHRAAQLVNAVHLRPEDRVLSLASPSTIGGLQQIFEVMLSGATLVKFDLQRTGLGKVVQAIGERHITMMFSTPSVWRSVARIDNVASTLTNLRCIQSSGDMLLSIDLGLLRQVLPGDCHVLSVYGATEAPALLQWFVPPTWPNGGPRVPTGYPLAGFAFALLDDSGNAVKEGEPGELVIKSSWMSLGIWRNGAVHPGPFERDERDLTTPVYRTGDIARQFPDGLFVTLGRKDRQVKVLGNRVELAEVETVLRQAPMVADAAVVARRTGGGAQLSAFVVPLDASSPGLASDVRAHLKGKLPAYMQPSSLFVIDELPLLPGRKIDEEALLSFADKDAPPAPVPSAPHPAVHVAQRAIDMINKAWRRAIGRPPPNDDRSFNEAGGDSLGLLLLVLHLEQSCGQALSLDNFHGEMKPSEFALALDRLIDGRPPAVSKELPVVFFIPGRRGDSPRLAQFRSACAATISIYSTTYPDLRQLARGGFEDIVTHISTQIEQLAPEGAIGLAGYSLGGDVAYAVAGRLQRRGRQISALLILDTSAEDFSPDDQPHVRRNLARRFATLLGLVKDGNWNAITEAIVKPSVVAKPISRHVLRFLSSFKIPIRSNFVFYLRWHLRAMLIEAHRTSWIKSAPTACLKIPVILFRSEDSTADLGWRARADALTIVPVGGDHLSMLERENSAELIAEFVSAVRKTSN
ncbi:MAG: AMP-binding protein [bacterium]|nr:AMP-binding protein [bacterium]